MGVKISRRAVLAILFGILTIITLNFLSQLIYLPITIPLSRKIGQLLSQPAYLAFRWVNVALSVVFFLLGGFVVGLVVGKKGLKYGGLSGVILMVLWFFWIVINYFLLATEVSYKQAGINLLASIAATNMIGLLFQAPMIIGVMALISISMIYYFRKKGWV